jgi:hypothetical protein
VSIKLVVSGSSKESRIALVGQTGKELLASTTFTEPRAKGATLRALKKILGADVLIEDSTKTNKPPARAVPVIDTVTERTAAVSAKPAAKKRAAASVRSRPQATAPAVKAAPPRGRPARKSAPRATKAVQPASQN